jgi:hypothetical protein
MIMYKLLKDQNGKELDVIQRTTDNAFISKSEDNTDYQKYLAWLAEGNEPLPPDE